jgi:hypothetical protein
MLDSSRPGRLAIAFVLALSVLAGCDVLYDGAWPGEPLLEVSGRAEDEGAASEAPRAAMLWLSASPWGLALRADDVPIETSFPADWEVVVHAIPSEEQFPGRWEDVEYLPDEPGVRTLFGVLVAYDDRDGDGSADFDYSGYGLLDWLNRRTDMADDVLVGTDVVLGMAPDFLVAAAQLPDGAQTLGEAVELEEERDLAALSDIEPGLHGYSFDEEAGAWLVLDPAIDVLLVLR